LKLEILAGPQSLGMRVFALCAVVVPLAGCPDSSSNDDTTTTTETTLTGTSTSTSMDTTADTTAGTGMDTGGSGSGDTGVIPTGIGCDLDPQSCDKGAYTGNFSVTDQASMLEIQGYTSITGVIQMDASEATCLNFLGCLETAGGVFIENNEALQNVNGLENLTSTNAFDVIVSRNPMLTDLSGFSGLQTVAGGNVHIFSNAGLTVLDAFPALTNVAGSVIVSENASMVELAGFAALTEIEPFANDMPPPPEFGGTFVVSQNPVLETISGFSGLIVVQRDFTITRNDVLTNLSGLYDVKAIGGAFVVTNNPQLCVSEAAKVGADLKQGPGPGSSTANNKEC
jgi:hypothetical protein